jgi:hypothetical protein
LRVAGGREFATCGGMFVRAAGAALARTGAKRFGHDALQRRAVRGSSIAELTAARTSSSDSTLQEQTIIAGGSSVTP